MPTGEQKRHRYTAEEKTSFVAVSTQPGYFFSLVTQQYRTISSLLFKGKRLINDAG